jgi:hypothetical protein
MVGAGMAGGPGAGGGLMAAASPWMLGASVGLGGLAALADLQGGKRRKRAFARQQEAQLNAVDLDTSAERQAVQEQYGDLVSRARNSMAERGLTGSTAMDAMLNTYGQGQQRAMSAISANRERARAAIMGQQGPQGPGAASALGGLAGLAAGAANLGFARQQADRQNEMYMRMLAGGGGAIGMDDQIVRNQLAGAEAADRMNGGSALWNMYYRRS